MKMWKVLFVLIVLTSLEEYHCGTIISSILDQKSLLVCQLDQSLFKNFKHLENPLKNKPYFVDFVWRKNGRRIKTTKNSRFSIQAYAETSTLLIHQTSLTLNNTLFTCVIKSQDITLQNNHYRLNVVTHGGLKKHPFITSHHNTVHCNPTNTHSKWFANYIPIESYQLYPQYKASLKIPPGLLPTNSSLQCSQDFNGTPIYSDNFIIDGLPKNEEDYFNDAFDHSHHKKIRITTLEALNSTAISVSWTQDFSKHTYGFKICLNPGEISNSDCLITQNVSSSQFFRVIAGLQKATKYYVTVSSFVQEGVFHSQSRLIQTDEDVPSEPLKLMLKTSNSTSVQAQWQAPLNPNGVILAYKIYYSEVTNQSDIRPQYLIHNVSSNATSTVINGLLPGGEYLFSVAALTKKGEGEKSKAENIKLKSSFLSAPQNFKAMVLKEDKPGVILSWNKPNSSLVIHQYKIIYSPTEQQNNPKKEFLAGTQSKTLIRYLDKGTEYTFNISASVDDEWGDDATLVLRTPEGVPIGSPMNISVIDVRSNSARLIWSPPMLKFRNGRIILYEVRELSDTSIEDWTTNTTNQFCTLSGLLTQKPYSYQVRAYTAIGPGPWSSPIFFVSAAEVSINPPRNIKLQRISESDLKITWNPVNIKENVVYQIYYTIHSVSDISEWQKTETSKTSTVLKNLGASSYVVRIKTRVPSLGKTSELSKVITETPALSMPVVSFPQPPQTQPLEDKVRNIVITVQNTTSKFGKQTILLEWQHPEKIGVKHYEIFYEGSKSYKDENDEEKQLTYKKEQRVDRSSTNVRLTGLQADTFYKFQITSCFMDLVCSTSMSVFQKTNVSKPPDFNAPVIETSSSDHNKILISFSKASGINGPILKYYLVLLTSKLYDMKTPEDYSNEELLNYAKKSGKFLKRSPSSLVIGIYSKLPKYFAFVREEDFFQNSNTFFKIIPGQNYKVFVRAFTSEKHYTSSPYSQVIRLESLNYSRSSITRNTKSNSNLTLILISFCVIFVLLIFFLTLITCFIKKKRDKKNSFSKNQYMSMVVQRPCTPVTFVKDEYSVKQKTSTSQPFSVHRFNKIMEELRRNDYELMRNEYESIDPGQEFTWEVSNKEENKSKNRFANVVAYDHSRVIIGKKESFLNGTRGSIVGSVHTNMSFNKTFEGENDDYINANYIDGYCKAKAYIATQGPLSNTINDFWLMVWEQRASIIVMLTNLEERGRVKCDQYWPSNSTELYGCIYVSLSSVNTFSTYTIRTFQLTNVNSMEKRIITQFQFTEWPDQGVPTCPSSLLLFVKRIKAFASIYPGPTIVHCSAGVGRTGVFITIDITLDRIQYEEMIDVYGCVTLMRSQRNYMVQTEEQYRFLYEVIEESIENGKCSIPADRLFGQFNGLVEINPLTGHSELELEFKKLNNDQNTFSYKTLGHKNKNRSQNILPNESSRVHLTSIHEVSSSDYINANFVHSYKDRKAFIATQAPLASTCEDFWRMVWECKCSIIVTICKLKENGKETCYQYWPDSRSVRHKYFVIDPIAHYNMPFYMLREFKMTDARDGQSRVVRQFQYSEWPENGVPSSGEGFIEFIGHIQKTKQQFGIENPIIVHCSMGAGRTGVFITLNNCIERLGHESIVDVYQTVKLIRLQRSCLIQKLDEYIFCYQAILEYLGSFDHLVS